MKTRALFATWTETVKISWVGDSQIGWPKTELRERIGEVVGYAQRYEKSVTVIVLADGRLHDVDIAEVTRCEWGAR